MGRDALFRLRSIWVLGQHLGTSLTSTTRVWRCGLPTSIGEFRTDKEYPMERRYVTIDVFTDRMFGGNPVAVVLDAAGLATTQMQAIAVEFNYSETTFIL